MADYDVYPSQCQAIFSSVDTECDTAAECESSVAGSLQTLTEASHHPDLVSAISRLQTEAFEPLMSAATGQLRSATGAGSEVLTYLNSGDQQMASASNSAQSQTPGALDAPGS